MDALAVPVHAVTLRAIGVVEMRRSLDFGTFARGRRRLMKRDPGAERDETERGQSIAQHHLASFPRRSEEHTSELQSLMRISYAVFCLKKKNNITKQTQIETTRRTP